MKSAQPTRLEDQGKGWNLSWTPEGRSDKFTRDAILGCAPAVSGIYGLFNFNCQIFIGESDNMQQALLRIESEADFWSEHLRPTGFTFELHPEESRKQKAAELIARYRPALQTLTDLRPPADETSERDPENRSELAALGEPAPGIHRYIEAKRAAYVVLSALLLSAGAVAYRLHQPFEPTERVEASPSEKIPASPSKAPVIAAEGARPAASGRTKSRQSHEQEMPRESNNSLRLVKSTNSSEAALRKLVGQASSEPGERATRQWSVQIAAVPAKDVADRMAQKLIDSGHEGYVVRAEVKGQTYYRVRAGRFEGREDAEAMRQSLAPHESYREAYVTRE